MDPGTVGRIEDWESVPVAGGFAGLNELMAGDFSGAVTTGGTWLFVLNGRIVGEVDGTVDDFEDADGTAYEAPHPGLPLLFAMQAAGGETEANYYTDDTPLAEVDGTLSEGNFTGYIELSENVLSGDYYVIYYGGRSMSVAFVGNAERLITDEEAFDRANDEVGIYEVKSVDLEVVSIPEPVGAEADSVPLDEPEATEADPGGTPVTEAGADATSDGDGDPAEPAEEASVAESTGETTPAEVGGEGADASGGAAGVESAPPEQSAPEGPAAGSEPADAAASESSETATEPPTDDESEDPFQEEEAWRKTRTIPALDPDESENRAEEAAPAEERQADDPTGRDPAGDRHARQPDRSAEPSADLEESLEERETKIRQLESRLESATEERDRLKDQRDRLQARLQSAGASDGDIGGEVLDPTTALTQTDLFVRYGSKGKATLQKAHDGEADQETVNANLRLEEHTRFDGSTASVDGQPYQSFLAEQIEYRFVRWVIEELLYEIVETDNQHRLRDLYDLIPTIDRAEFRGTVTVGDGTDESREESFDVIMRDRMGAPLVVANVNDDRDPASAAMMESLVGSATAVGDTNETLGGAFFVTASFFEPDALESAETATRSGFLNRESRGSFVKLSRKQGFHLCLVEARGDEFHVTVPDL